MADLTGTAVGGMLSGDNTVKALLKVYYKDGVENLMFRNSPVLKKIKKSRVEGKTVNFAALAARGGAVAGDFTVAEKGAAETAHAVEFQVEPGQLFSVYSMNSKEVQAAQTKRGAYMKIAGAKMFAASESFRKTLAAALYGSGYGEIAKYNGEALSINTAGDITLPASAIMAIDIGSKLVLKSTINASTVDATFTVNSIDGNTVNVTSDTAVSSGATGYVCLAGSCDGTDPLLPIGLGAWLPTDRSGLPTSFCNVVRSKAPDRLAGVFYDASAVTGTDGKGEKMALTVQKLMQKCRRQGSQADLIIMNDEDFLSFSQEIESTNTYFTQTSTKAKKEASVGVAGFSASFSTNYIENIIDDPYCPKGRFYILDSEYVELWSYTNADKISDGVEGNAAGKANPMEMDDEGHTSTPYGLIIDDYLNIQPGSSSMNGPAMEITLQFFGAFAVTNPSVCGVGKFYGASGIA